MSVRAVAVIRPVNNPRYSPVPYQPVSQGQFEASQDLERSVNPEASPAGTGARCSRHIPEAPFSGPNARLETILDPVR